MSDAPTGRAGEASSDSVRRRLTRRFPLVDDHPDVAGLLRDPDVLALLGPALAEPYRAAGVTKVLAPEARGPIVGALVARELGAGLVLARKDDRNHPGADTSVRSDTTWRGQREVFRSRSFDLDPADRVLLVDDWVTTGSSLRALRSIVELAGARSVGTAVIVNKATPEVVADLDVHWLVRFDDVVS